ncbi:MAG: Asp-tRNA(Asn)/Glu-tRNA(Gln) amidotransferase subunit GatA, partial [Clostridia bacterium]|nr:Asp-tRNA(Asn)/Glu-tRNA(Gln) amidotransferase subunit GatA [Clostridia bacterium]
MRELICDIAKQLRNGETTSVELTQKYIKQIEDKNPLLNAYVKTTFDIALEQAKLADQKIASGSADILCGIPMTLKDNISTSGIETTCCSKILK